MGTKTLYIVNANEVIDVCSERQARALVERYRRGHVNASMRPLDMNDPEDKSLYELVNNVQNFS